MIHRLGPTPLASYSMMLLVAINLFNYIDRQVLAAVEPQIRKELISQMTAAGMPEPSEAEAKRNSGFLATAFLVSYMLLAPVFGWFAEFVSRWKLIGIGVILWSLASGASGIDWGLGPIGAFFALLITRCFVGVGEGGYGPVAPAIISDLFRVEDRGKALARFYVAIPVGGALGYAFGEVISGWLGWRWAFYLVVPPGIALGIACFFFPDPPRGQMEQFEEGTRRGIHKYLGLFSIPSFVLNTLGMTAMTFAIGALSYWMADYLTRRNVPDLFGRAWLAPITVFGIITALAGLLATLAGGWAGDKLRSRFSGSYFLVSGAAMLFCFPMILAFIYTPFPYAWFFVFGAVFCMFFNTGPTNTILANVTHPSVRASGFALNILIIHLFGDAISPPIIGDLSGRYGDDFGFIVVAAVALVGGLFWIWGSAFLERDTRLAGTRG